MSNPFSTGGGGTKFEYEVGALFLAALLTDDIPAGISDGKIQKIQFQASYTGTLLDDIVITVSNNIQRVTVAYQIKHNLKFSRSDNIFKDAIKDCWKTFQGQTNTETNMVGIGIGVHSQKFEHLQTLLESARTTLDSQEFSNKVNLRHFSSDEKRELMETIRISATDAKASAITGDELWRFLRSLIIYHFDMRENGRDRIYCINSLRKNVEGQDINKAKTLFHTLYSIVGKYAVSGGSIDKASLVSIGEVRSQIVDTKPHEIQLNSKAQIILNDNVFKLLATVAVKNDSPYSITLTVSDGRLANKLPYIRHAEAFLASQHNNIHSQWQNIKELVSRYNENASSITRTIQNSIREVMEQHFQGLIESDHFHLITPNSYSMPSLLELTWSFCKEGEHSELVQFFSSNFSKLPNSSFGWVLSRDLRGGGISAADSIVTSSIEQFADPNVIIPVLKSIGQLEGMTTNFNVIKSIGEELGSLINEFSDNIKDLSELIELTVTD